MVDAGQGSRWWAARATRLSVSELEQVTRAYWDRHKPAPDATVAQRMEWYIERLLPEELCYADEKRQALHEHPCHTLALLVGHSPEPLFQAIGVFRPRRVVLVLNQTYGTQEGEQRGSEMKEQVQAAETLLQVLRFYEAWGDGDYFRAKQLLPGLQQRLPAFSPPQAVTLLGDVWPHTDGTSGAEGAAVQLLDLHDRLRIHPHSIFESNVLLVTYARDELAKIERLVDANEDNRSALLRAAGLDELLLKARLVRLWHAGDEGWIDLWDQDETRVGRCRTLDQEVQDKLYEALVNHQGTDHMRRAPCRGTLFTTNG